MDALSTYMSEAANRPLPDEVVEKTKHHILDTLGASLAYSRARADIAADPSIIASAPANRSAAPIRWASTAASDQTAAEL